MEKHKYGNEEFWVYYPAYTCNTDLVVYGDEIIWDREQHPYEYFCFAVVSYREICGTMSVPAIINLAISYFLDNGTPTCPDLEQKLYETYEKLCTPGLLNGETEGTEGPLWEYTQDKLGEKINKVSNKMIDINFMNKNFKRDK